MDDLAVKILQDWRNQNNTISTTLANVVGLYDELAKEGVCEILSGLADALDDCSGNLAESIAGMTESTAP
jgi:hypothetical protein